MIGEKIYNLLIEQGKNPVEFLRSMSFDFPDDIELTDIDHKERVQVIPLTKCFKSGIDLSLKEKIQLSDGCETECFYVSYNKIYLRNGIVVGEYNYWKDDEMDIPPIYKNTDNVVLNPETDDQLFEYFLYSSSNIYHDLNTDMLYREFKYDYGLDQLLRITAANKIQ
jgi:hypothetical protein